MSKGKFSSIGLTVMIAVLSAAGPALTADSAPMTPELAAKAEMVRKQQEQRITPEKRKAAAEALKAERLKIHKAKQGQQNLNPGSTDSK